MVGGAPHEAVRALGPEPVDGPPATEILRGARDQPHPADPLAGGRIDAGGDVGRFAGPRRTAPRCAGPTRRRQDGGSRRRRARRRGRRRARRGGSRDTGPPRAWRDSRIPLRRGASRAKTTHRPGRRRRYDRRPWTSGSAARWCWSRAPGRGWDGRSDSPSPAKGPTWPFTITPRRAEPTPRPSEARALGVKALAVGADLREDGAVAGAVAARRARAGPDRRARQQRRGDPAEAVPRDGRPRSGRPRST